MIQTLILADKPRNPFADFSIAAFIQLDFLIDPIRALLELQELPSCLNFREHQMDESWQLILAQLLTQFIVVRQLLRHAVQESLLLGNFEQVAQGQRISLGALLAFLSAKGACLGVYVAR